MSKGREVEEIDGLVEYAIFRKREVSEGRRKVVDSMEMEATTKPNVSYGRREVVNRIAEEVTKMN